MNNVIWNFRVVLTFIVLLMRWSSYINALICPPLCGQPIPSHTFALFPNLKLRASSFSLNSIVQFKARLTKFIKQRTKPIVHREIIRKLIYTIRKLIYTKRILIYTIRKIIYTFWHRSWNSKLFKYIVTWRAPGLTLQQK